MVVKNILGLDRRHQWNLRAVDHLIHLTIGIGRIQRIHRVHLVVLTLHLVAAHLGCLHLSARHQIVHLIHLVNLVHLAQLIDLILLLLLHLLIIRLLIIEIIVLQLPLHEDLVVHGRIQNYTIHHWVCLLVFT